MRDPFERDAMKGHDMAGSRDFCRVSLFFILALVLLGGCGVTRGSRIYLDTSYTSPGGMVISNFSIDEVDEYVRSFVLQKGYEIVFTDSSEAWFRQEFPDDGTSLIWLARKSGEPSILFLSADGKLIVSFHQDGPLPSFRITDSMNVLYRILAERFGEQYVRISE